MTDSLGLDRIVAEAPREELPELLGAVVAAEARIRLRLAELPAAVSSSTKVLTVDEAAAIADTSKRWLLAHTAGLAFRCDLSRKQPRFREDGPRAWLARRSR